ncbi:MAG: WYL domain-containing protein [Bacteroidales bacterium]|nr:WYL domain-containing protein [Bacteroidales bacterium]
MKTSVLFKEYIWLINTIYRAERITLAEINEKWLQSDMSCGIEIARTTFNRHKNSIEDIFGIIIECDKKDGFKYYIEDKSVLHEDTLQKWMLSSMTVHTAVQEGLSLHKRILLEEIPSGYNYLQPILEAMKTNHCITFSYQKYNDAEIKSYTEAEPYCLKLYKQRWYLLIKNKTQFRIFSLDRIKSLDISAETFKLSNDFDAEAYFHNYYGVFCDERTKPQRVILRASKEERPYLRDLPLHHSQEEISVTPDYSDFSYYIHPSDDFIGEILRKKDRLYVVSPKDLQGKILKSIRQMEHNYKKRKKD